MKVANEAPSDIKSNITRGWANFTHDRIEGCTKKTEFKACLFALCWFHSIVLGRRRFGQQGWSRKYSFNTGQLLYITLRKNCNKSQKFKHIIYSDMF